MTRSSASPDLIDRGPRSAHALAWLTGGRLTGAARGNHEQMMVNALSADQGVWLRKSGPGSLWLENGADWWYDSQAVKQERARRKRGVPFVLAERWLAALRVMPYVMTLDCGETKVGVVHAPGACTRAATSWPALCAMADIQHQRDSERRSEWELLAYELLWAEADTLSERCDAAGLPEALAGIDLVIAGHSPGRWPRWARRNVLCIDTGVHYDELGHLTVAEVHGASLELHRFARVSGA